MSFTIKKQVVDGPVYRATTILWLTKDRSRVVPDGHPEAGFLFAHPARPIPIEDARRYGLVEDPKAGQTETNVSTTPGIKEAKVQETKEIKVAVTKQAKRRKANG